MLLTLKRKYLNDQCTIGELLVDGQHNCVVLEDRVREVPGVPVEKWKLPSITAIPYGVYEVITNFSQRFQREMPLLLNVPGYTGVRIHPGNTAVDTDGCLLVGTAIGNNAVLNSREAFSLLFLVIKRAIAEGTVKLSIELDKDAEDVRT